MVVKLVVASGKSAGRTIAVKRTRFLIGRAEECDIRPLSDEVSRRHCAIVVGPEAVSVEDLGSRNGTYVNGERIKERTPVTDGDLLRVGSLELRFSCTSQGGAGGSEDDISRWLMTEGDGSNTTAARSAPAQAPAEGGKVAETVAERGDGDTVTGIRRPPADAAGTDAAQAGNDDSSVAHRRKAAAEAVKSARAAPGSLPHQASKSDSSKDAAAQALKKFFEGR